MLRKILSVLTNRFVVITLCFLAWIIFFADNDLVSQYKDQKESKALEEKVKYLESEIERMKARSAQLKTDTAAIIQYAREQYLMKKADEDIFVFDTVNTKK
jgi:cell division protein DivIC